MNFNRFLKRHKDIILDGLLLFGLMLLFFLRFISREPYGLFTGSTLDIRQDLVMNHLLASLVKQGGIPLWDPYFFGPIIAYLNSGFFYPLNILTNFFISLSGNDLNFGYSLIKLSAFFHFFLASFFMYLLGKNLGLNRLPSIFMGIIFGYCGYLVKEYIHIQYLEGAIWLPLVFLFFYQSLSGSFKKAVIAGVIYGFSLLAGQTQPAIYYVFLLFLLTSYFSFSLYREKKRNYLMPFFNFLVTILVAFSIFAIQFFPTWEYTKYAMRTEMRYEDAVGYSASPLYILTHPFFRNMWGGMESGFWNGMDEKKLIDDGQTKWLYTLFSPLPNEMNFYLGLLPLLLLPFAFFSKRIFFRNFFLLLLISSVFLMITQYLGTIGEIFYFLVGDRARVPVRASFLWSFAFAFLAALGLEAIIKLREEKAKIFQKISHFYFLILGILVFFVLPLFIFLLLSSAGTPKFNLFYFPITESFSLFLLFYLISSLLILFWLKSSNLLTIIVLLVVFVIDLFSFHWANSFLLFKGGTPEEIVGQKFTPEIAFLKEDKDLFRVHGLGFAGPGNNFYTLGYGTTGTFGFAHKTLVEFYRLAQDDGSPIYDLANVKYFYAPDGKIKDLLSSVGATTFISNHLPQLAFDGKEETEWVANPEIKLKEGDWIGATFPQETLISRIDFLGRDNEKDKEVGEMMLFSNNAKSQKIVLPGRKGWKSVAIEPIKTQLVKLVFSKFDSSFGSGEFYGFKEIRFFHNEKIVPVGNPKFKKLTDNLYLNKAVLPRAFVTYSSRSFNNKNELFLAILSDRTGEEMRKTVFLSQPIFSLSNSQPVSPTGKEAIVREYRPQKVIIEAQLAQNGFLVLSDTWYPGWKAKVDGQEVEILQTYHLFRAVQVPSGRHTVVFEYDPASFKIGLIITSLTVAGLVVYFLPRTVWKKKK